MDGLGRGFGPSSPEMEHGRRMFLTELRRWSGIGGILCAVTLCGCARLDNRLQRGDRPPGAPAEEAILSELAAEDQQIETFLVRNALLTVESPRLKATQKVSAEIAFRRPDRLHIVGRQQAFRNVVFRLTSVGREFMVDIPREGEPTYRREGETVEGVPFAVSPSDIARELFLPEDWSRLRRNDVRLIHYDPATATATLEVGPRNRPRRRMVVQGPEWHVVMTERLNDAGEVFARTLRSDYRVWDGIRFPGVIVAEFPTLETTLRLEKINRPRFNEPLEDDLFDIDWPDDPDTTDGSHARGDRPGAGA